jgi:glycosyltransferase involved in cell wall biosynthesis
MLITVVVPVFNKAQLLRQSLDSIVAAAHRDGETELILVDNGSTDGSYELLRAYSDVAAVRQVRGGTIASVRNEGARHSRGELLSFIDCDCVVRPEYFRDLRHVLASSGAAASGCECDIPTPAHWTEKTWHALHALDGDGFCHYLNSANFAVRRAVFDEVGGFDERLTTGEDTDICRRIRGAGHRIFEARRLSVVHLANPKSVREFFHKQKWHGVSVLNGASSSLLRNKATMMVFAHVGAVMLALAVLSWPAPMTAASRLLLASSLAVAVPAITVVYRFAETRRLSNPIAAVLLYAVFYFARAAALLSSVRVRATARLAALLPIREVAK